MIKKSEFNQILTVISYEYLQNIKRLSFWAGTLLLPIFFIVIMIISLIGGAEIAQSESSQAAILEASEIRVVDQANFLSDETLASKDKVVRYTTSDIEQSINLIEDDELAALIVYPENFKEINESNNEDIITEINNLISSEDTDEVDNKILIYTKDTGVFNNSPYTNLARELIETEGFNRIREDETKELITGNFRTSLIDLNKNASQFNIGRAIGPFIAIIFFFTIVFNSGQVMLQSISEEKENRMLESLLAIIPSHVLIFGKIISYLLLSLTQLGVWILSTIFFLIIGSTFANLLLPPELFDFQFGTFMMSLFLILAGTLSFSALMVGIGSLGESYKDSQGLSGIFTIFSIFPLYLLGILFSQPLGIVARTLSYLPLTSPLVFLVRLSITPLPTWEIILGIILNIFYVIFSFWISLKLFRIGSLMYSRKPSFAELRKELFKLR